MADTEDRTVTLVARFVPDENGGPFASKQEAEAAGHDTLTPATGTYQVGVLDDGAFVPFFEEAWANVAERIATAKAAAEADTTASK